MLRTLFFAGCLLCCAAYCNAQASWNDVPVKGAVSVDTIRRQGYTLVFVNLDTALATGMQQKLTGTFFTVYPKEAALFNRASIRQVVMVMDTAYKGVAATDNGIIRINPGWMHKHPEDLDVVTHEAMHLVQAYPEDAGPGWVTEGIADYVRYKLGVNNAAAGWALPAYQERQSYQDAYRVTARFFVWLERHGCKGLVKRLDQAMRTKTYTEAFWRQNTGKTVEALWKAYAAAPEL